MGQNLEWNIMLVRPCMRHTRMVMVLCLYLTHAILLLFSFCARASIFLIFSWFTSFHSSHFQDMDFLHSEGPTLGQDNSRYRDFKALLCKGRIHRNSAINELYYQVTLPFVEKVENEALRALSVKGVINQCEVAPLSGSEIAVVQDLGYAYAVRSAFPTRTLLNYSLFTFIFSWFWDCIWKCSIFLYCKICVDCADPGFSLLSTANKLFRLISHKKYRPGGDESCNALRRHIGLGT